MTALDYYTQQGIGTGRVGYGRLPAVVIVDMQRDLDPEVFLYLGEAAQQSVDPQRRLAVAARSAGVHVIYAKTVYRQDGKDLGCWPYKFTRLVEQGLKEGTPGVEIVPELAPQPGDYVMEKRRPSAFFATGLDLYLRSLNVDTVIITGCTTSGCIRASAVDSFSYGYRTIIPVQCVADRSEEPHRANLFDMNMKYADVTDMDEVLQYFDTLKGR